MFSGVEEHVIYQIANAPIREYPFPHIYVEAVFPQDFYAALRRNWPTSSHLVSLGSTGRVSKGAYAERFILSLDQAEVGRLPDALRGFWTEVGEWLLAPRFLDALIEKFERYIRKRFGNDLGSLRYAAESLIMRDQTNYKLRPHTDSPDHLLSLLFYCPDDESRKHLGTTIYTPLNPDFRCPGGPDHPREMFRRVTTMEYRPNTLFAFLKTDNSFHGVEPIHDADVMRDLLLYDVRVAMEPQAVTGGGVRGSASLGIKMLKHIFGAKG